MTDAVEQVREAMLLARGLLDELDYPAHAEQMQRALTALDSLEEEFSRMVPEEDLSACEAERDSLQAERDALLAALEDEHDMRTGHRAPTNTHEWCSKCAAIAKAKGES